MNGLLLKLAVIHKLQGGIIGGTGEATKTFIEVEHNTSFLVEKYRYTYDGHSIGYAAICDHPYPDLDVNSYTSIDKEDAYKELYVYLARGATYTKKINLDTYCGRRGK